MNIFRYTNINYLHKLFINVPSRANYKNIFTYYENLKSNHLNFNTTYNRKNTKSEKRNK